MGTAKAALSLGLTQRISDLPQAVFKITSELLGGLDARKILPWSHAMYTKGNGNTGLIPQNQCYFVIKSGRKLFIYIEAISERFYFNLQ